MNDFMLAIFGAPAKFERKLISERVKYGLAREKKRQSKTWQKDQRKNKGST